MKKTVLALMFVLASLSIYAKGEMGESYVTINAINSKPTGDDIKDLDNSWGISGAYGYKIAENLFLEGELAYRLKFKTDDSGSDYDGYAWASSSEDKILTLLANVKYFIPAGENLNPYLKAGLGWRNDKMKSDYDSDSGDYMHSSATDNAVDMDLGAGISINAGIGAIDIGVTYNHAFSTELKDSDLLDFSAGYSFKL